MASDELIAGLEAAVQAAPDNRDLRLHLAAVLSQAGRYDQALAHAETILGEAPADADALAVAAIAAEQTGHPKAGAYRQLSDALGSSPADPPSAPPPPPQQPPPPPQVAQQSPPPEAAQQEAAQETRPEAAQQDPPEQELQRLPAQGPADMPDSVDDLLDLWDDDAPVEPDVGELTQPSMTLDDVGGMEDVKERLRMSFLAPMNNPELAAAFSRNMNGGMLLWGPPGCGKTFLARAIAGELGANFYSIGLSDVLDMYIGSSERNLTAVFDVARRNNPCLLFFDEMDALGQKRTNLRASGSAMRGVVNQFLTELDGVNKDNDGLFILGATNHPWDVDSALLRPGRFDRMMLVLPPDEPARIAILDYHMRGRPHDGLDFAKIAARTKDFSGADLALLCEAATDRAMNESLRKGSVLPVTMRDFKAALKEVRVSTGPWFDTARNYALYSNESGTFDDLLAYLKKR
jgi:SpoVK/Ycf46/Vps4 family AAA+-type ATPase